MTKGKGLTKEQAQEIRQFLEQSKKPLFFHHDDPDGLCSFLLLYRLIKRGSNIPVKSSPSLTVAFLNYVEEHNPDTIFVTDLFDIEQEFIDRAAREGTDKEHEPARKIVWLDHHSPADRQNVHYYNPRIKDSKANIPASVMAFEVNEKDIWLAAVGAIGDWHFPWFAEQFKKKYPELLPESVNNPDDALFTTKLGELVFIFSFILKSRTSDMKKCIKAIAQMDEPAELLNGNNGNDGKTEGKIEEKGEDAEFVLKIYNEVNEKYQKLLWHARQAAEKCKGEKVVEFICPSDKDSFTKDIANRLLYENSDKVIVIGRERAGEMKLSMRAKNFILPPILEKALNGLQGFGGGHEHACGASVKKQDYPEFMERLRQLIP